MSATRSSGHLLRWNFECSVQVDVPGQEFLDAVNGMVGDAAQDVGQVGFWIQSVQFRGTQQGIHRGGALAACIGTCKQVVLASQRYRSQCTFRRIVVDFQAAIMHIPK